MPISPRYQNARDYPRAPPSRAAPSGSVPAAAARDPPAPPLGTRPCRRPGSAAAGSTLRGGCRGASASVRRRALSRLGLGSPPRFGPPPPRVAATRRAASASGRSRAPARLRLGSQPRAGPPPRFGPPPPRVAAARRGRLRLGSQPRAGPPPPRVAAACRGCLRLCSPPQAASASGPRRSTSGRCRLPGRRLCTPVATKIVRR
ncbi:hypothetical protein BS78_01G028800 [Paspalum vaginatum]|nr:hypothetical protein BS78_01G028800 [Paspalum vaginatum]